MLGRAELAVSGESGATRLAAVLGGGGVDQLAAEEVYVAAYELGVWSLVERRFETATLAWDVAERFAQGSVYGATYGSARVRTWQAAQVFLEETGRRGRGRMDRENAYDAYLVLTDVLATLRPLADIDNPNLQLSVAQQAYAEALAWRMAFRAKLSSDGQPLPDIPQDAQGDADGAAEIGPIDLTLPRCLYRFDRQPPPRYPQEALRRGGIGGVVLRLQVNEAGEIVDNRAVVSIGDAAFSSALEGVATRWRVSRHEDSAPNCRMAGTVLIPIYFTIRARGAGRRARVPNRRPGALLHPVSNGGNGDAPGPVHWEGVSHERTRRTQPPALA
jgi:TonB family protein